ncbi:MAG: hypothetical protein ACUVQQ_10370, partial [Thermogutta sp.]
PTSFAKRSQVLTGLAAVSVFFDCHVRHLNRSGILGTRAIDGSTAEQERLSMSKPSGIGFLSGTGDSGSEANYWKPITLSKKPTPRNKIEALTRHARTSVGKFRKRGSNRSQKDFRRFPL